ncbi:MAG: SDR family oxidoreductase [Deltaproteobacteria bacterium]|nr:SDR family oxidoreductase [Deltaproteobacteria bacterium]
MDLKLTGKTAIVTGGGRGIGRGIALSLAAEGATVVVPDLTAEDAQKVIAEIAARGGAGLALEADAADEKEIERIIERTKEAYGDIDIVVNNVAGGTGPVPIARMAVLDWDRVIELTLKSAFLFSRAAAREMIPRKQGRIINIASLAGRIGQPLMGPYSVGKFGVVGLTQVMAKELGRYAITVNAVCPGFVYTPGFEQTFIKMKDMYSTLKDKSPKEIFMDTVKEQTVLGQPQTPEDVGSLVAFLASEEAKNITGQAISVDGGAAMR